MINTYYLSDEDLKFLVDLNMKYPNIVKHGVMNGITKYRLVILFKNNFIYLEKYEPPLFIKKKNILN